jgi:hypothetical protein
MVDSFKQNFTTNANGDITKQTASQNFGGQWLPFFTINFYYEPVPTQAPSKINPLASNVNIDLFPNPANAVLQLSIKTPKAVDCKVIITDVLGKQISAENLSANQLNLPNQINITSLQVGTYLLSIIMPNGEVVSKKFNKI